MRICFVVAMRAEAQPLIEHYNLKLVEGAFSPLPCLLYEKASSTNPNGTSISVVVNGTQCTGSEERDLIGCEAACVATMSAINRYYAPLPSQGGEAGSGGFVVISSGTCGGWQRYGMQVGKVYVADGVMFHDRRVPGDNVWDTQGLGNYPVWEGSKTMAETLGLPMGKVTTGSSFDLTPEEDAFIDKNGGRLKEMEGAAVAFVCSLYKVPVMLVKAVTNLRDVEEDGMEDFQANLKKASDALLEANIKIIDYLSAI